MGFVGFLHVTFGVLALVLGFVILGLTKGTQLHRVLGVSVRGEHAQSERDSLDDLSRLRRLWSVSCARGDQSGYRGNGFFAGLPEAPTRSMGAPAL